ncbi:NACHT domain-containing protein [Roseovarius sp. S1116L3]|uniref:NACHT domain-containing protein n=1 Tax=Roseovarius roseus TaxID=3342636 RepID=UPI00372B5513
MTKNKNRDDFTPATKRAIERQARGHCSNPACRRLTHASTSEGNGEINIGQASHICAAAPGGPRYDPQMTSEERRAAENGIWLCDVHGRAVDTKDSKFTVEELHRWKKQTNEDSWRSVMHNVTYGPGMQALTPDELGLRLRTAASADLAVFRRTPKWPGTNVALTMTLKVKHVDEALSTRALANAVTSLDDLILVAAPGMGKTTTLFQVADGLLEIGNGTPLIVPLGDWATEGEALLASLLKRPAFNGISEQDFRTVATKPGVVLLLDGWNELDAAARERARVQITALKTELPELGLVISTRKQALDIPFGGTRVDLLPLDDEQQMEIARGMRGEAGAQLVDQAWRTAGVRDLVTIPLYLTALLSLPENAPFPTTKEEVLRRFVAAHEQEARRAAALHAVVHGFQHDYLDDLSVLATTTANTAIMDSNARRSIAETARALVNDGQITITTQPDLVLDVLVSNHVLTRAGETPGYSFQHQQFQEWYASRHVERLMLQAVSDQAVRDRLKADVFNKRPWEEPVLFAVERTARGEAAQKTACSAAILAAFEVDPMLAGEMIFRATDDVWAPVGTLLRNLAEQWHAPGKVDRAVRFMIASGRPEFSDLVWALVTHADDQVHLHALRAAKQFRPSVLGNDAPARIAALPPEIRKNVLHEIASHGGIDGLDLATAIAKTDRDPYVKATVVDALSFRRADRHVADLLANAGDATYDILAEKGHLDDIAVDAVQRELQRARERREASGISHFQRLRTLVHAPGGDDRDAEVAEIVAEMEIDRKRDGELHLLYEVRRRYPQALAKGLLRRVREHRDLFYDADNILAAAGFSLEDDKLLGIALEETNRHDDLADAAASVLGPIAVGRLIDAYLAAGKVVRDACGKYDQAAGDRYHGLRDRIGHTPGASLVAAVQARAADADNEKIVRLAELFSRESNCDEERARPFSDEGLAAIGVLAHKWAERMLAARDEKRWCVATLATMMSRAPSVAHLPLLKRMLDDNLHRYRAFREKASASGWKNRDAVHEAQHPHMHEYQRAFLAIKAPETAALMRQYLTDEHFGELAARVLAAQWFEANEPKEDKKFLIGVDFSRVEARREARATDPAATSNEAEAIFDAIETLIVDGSSDAHVKLAVTLGIVGARLPHGQRDAMIQKLISLAPRQARAALLLSLLLSGEDIDIKLVADGIAETFEAAEKETWILTQSDAYQLRDWLRLLPFATPVTDLPAIVRGMPDAQRHPRMLEEMIRELSNSSSDKAEDVTFALAEDDPRLYQNHAWRETALRFGTLSAARHLIDLTVSGALNGRSYDGWHWKRELGGLISEFSEVRAYVHDLLKDGPITKPLGMLAGALAEDPGTHGLLMLIDFENGTGRLYVDWRVVESVVSEHVPAENWENAYNIAPLEATDLRRKLLAITKSGDRDDPAARCLDLIDKLRDEYGAPESEPRHPDLGSGRPWPILTPDLDAVEKTMT